MVVNVLPSRHLPSTCLPSAPWFAGAGGQAQAALDYAEQITVGMPGRCSKEPTLLIELFDNSGSITGGNDPIGQRFGEAYIAISRVGARCRCGRDLVATYHFDTPTSGDLPPTPITPEHHQDIQRSLAVPADGAGASLLGASLTAARELVGCYPKHRAVLVVHTDFELFDDYLGDLIAFPGDVHAVVLRSTPPPILVEAPNVIVTRVDHNSQPGTLARAVFNALTATRRGAKPLPAVR